MTILPNRCQLTTFLFSALLLLSTGNLHANSLPDFTKLAKKQSQAVVNISTKKYQPANSQEIPPQFRGLPDEWLKYFFNQPDPSNPRDEPNGGAPQHHSLGSGFIVSEDGYIVTNHHVIDGADEIFVRFNDLKVKKAQVMGSDPRTDIALLKVKRNNLPIITFGNSAKLKVGAWVIAIGSPFGFDYSVTAGIVSAKERSLPADAYVSFIQTDVAINPGNSGGPLFDLNGNVVGVNSQIYSRSGGFMGVSFAIPSNLVKYIVKELKEKGSVSRGYLGVQIQEITSELSETFHMSAPHGALVSAVIDDTPAQKGGIEVGDVIVNFNGTKINRSYNLPPIVGITPIGKKVPVKIIRNGKPKTLNIAVDELEPRNRKKRKKRNNIGYSITRVGIKVINLSDEMLNELQQGILVKDVFTDGPANRAGIEKNDVILTLQNHEIESVSQFRKIVESAPKRTRFRVLIYRNQRTLFTTLFLP
jgi:serine protease Do